MSNNVPIRCAHSAVVDPSTLQPHPRNPNEHPQSQIDVYVSILRFQGWRRAITVSNRSGFITKGHGAQIAAVAAGMTEVPVDYQDYENEATELADIVADNQLSRLSQMNTGKLLEITNDLRAVETFDVSMTAISAEGLRALSWESDLSGPRGKVGGVTPHTDPIPGLIEIVVPKKELTDEIREKVKEFIASHGAVYDGITVA